ncbi:tyrosine-type recombinase/integrase [Natrialbaceae archaeon A-CW1-1]
MFSRYLTDVLDSPPLENLTNDDLEEFSEWLDYECGLAHSTLSHRWYAVRLYLNTYVDDEIGYIDREDEWILKWLDKRTQTNRHNNPDVHWLPQDDIKTLIDAAKNLKNRLVIQLLWHTGCRPSELARMQTKRHNFDNRSIKIRTSKVHDTKKDNYERTVFYSRSMRSDMREWVKLGGRDSYPYADDSSYLIVGYNTPSISARQVNKIVRDTAERAGIQSCMIKTAAVDGDGNQVEYNQVTPKTLRHSFAVHCVRGRKLSGTPPMDLERLRQLMGHSSLETTRYYLQFRESELLDVYDQSHPG